MGYWGFPNGQIPLNKMALYRGVLLRADAAAQAYALQEAYTKATGKPLVILEGYRDLTRQKVLRNLYLSGRGNIAAIPGLSNHGWGLACDFAAPLNSSGSAEHRWMRQNAPLWGFDWNRGKADNEPWHWEYGNVRVSNWAALDKESIDMALTPEQDARLSELWNRLLPGQEGRKFDGDYFTYIKDFRTELTWLREQMDRLEPVIRAIPYDTAYAELDHPIAKNADGTPLKVRLADVVKYEPLEHANTREAIARLGTLQFTDKQLATIGAGVKPVDEASLVKKITESVVQGVKALFGRAAA